MSQSSSVPLSPSLTPDYSLTGANATWPLKKVLLRRIGISVPYPAQRCASFSIGETGPRFVTRFCGLP